MCIRDREHRLFSIARVHDDEALADDLDAHGLLWFVAKTTAACAVASVRGGAATTCCKRDGEAVSIRSVSARLDSGLSTRPRMEGQLSTTTADFEANADYWLSHLAEEVIGVLIAQTRVLSVVARREALLEVTVLVLPPLELMVVLAF